VLRGPVKKICENCGQVFECGGYQCWCGRFGISQEQMDWIEKSFHDCLCPLCLQQVVDGKLGPFSVTKPP
jgi:Cysteine-rich CWC